VSKHPQNSQKNAGKKAAGSRPRKAARTADNPLFNRVVSILEQARGNVVRAVNTNMVLAYWLIGREIVEEVQGGVERAEYGEQVLENLSARLTEHYGKGYSVTNLKYFRLFFQAYPGRMNVIRHPAGDELAEAETTGPLDVELSPSVISHPAGKELGHHKKSYPLGTELPQEFPQREQEQAAAFPLERQDAVRQDLCRLSVGKKNGLAQGAGAHLQAGGSERMGRRFEVP
jgi:hypothetical protein